MFRDKIQNLDLNLKPSIERYFRKRSRVWYSVVILIMQASTMRSIRCSKGPKVKHGHLHGIFFNTTARANFTYVALFTHSLVPFSRIKKKTLKKTEFVCVMCKIDFKTFAIYLLHEPLSNRPFCMCVGKSNQRINYRKTGAQVEIFSKVQNNF